MSDHLSIDCAANESTPVFETLAGEFEEIDLGDKRHNRRALRGDRAAGPAAAGQHPHSDRRLERIKHHPVVLVAQDTTELDYTGKNDIEGLGPLNYETRRGLYLHTSLAITPERLSLGQLDSWSWTRPGDVLLVGRAGTEPLA